MKVKDAGFFQLHIEKIALGIGVFFLMITIAVMVLGLFYNPYQIEIGGRVYDDPAQVIPVLVEQSRYLQERLPSDGTGRPEEVPEDYEPPDMETNFRQMLQQQVVTEVTFRPIAAHGLRESATALGDITPPTYYLPSPPVVTDVLVKHGFEVLGLENEPVATGYFDFWGAPWREPADFSYVWVEGRFDIGAWEDLLSDTRSYPDMVPQGIWSRKLGLSSVYLVREELDPVTGQWGNRTDVRVLPGYAGVSPGQNMSDVMAVADENIGGLLEQQEAVMMPPPPPLSGGGVFLSPFDDPLTGLSEEELEAMERAERQRERERNAQDPDGPGPGRRAANVNADASEEDPRLRVWAIDATVQPGAIYRYKLVAAVINPLYGVARLEESQLSANRFRADLSPAQETLDSLPWLDPIEIEPRRRFFVVSANEREAQVKVWRVFNGERVNDRFKINPGDRIGGRTAVQAEDMGEVEVEMLVDAVVVDIDRRRDVSGDIVWTLTLIDSEGALYERRVSEDSAASVRFERFVRDEKRDRERADEMQDNADSGG